MASEPRTQTVEDIALDAVEKIDAYLDGSLTPDEVSDWAKSFFGAEAPRHVIVEAALDVLAAVGQGEYDTSADELREFRSYLLGERDYVVHHRMVHWKSARAAALRKA
jgi:hypothetical protein